MILLCELVWWRNTQMKGQSIQLLHEFDEDTKQIHEEAESKIKSIIQEYDNSEVTASHSDELLQRLRLMKYSSIIKNTRTLKTNMPKNRASTVLMGSGTLKTNMPKNRASTVVMGSGISEFNRSLEPPPRLSCVQSMTATYVNEA
jgi:pyridoxal biosynthesis lyase PdxS